MKGLETACKQRPDWKPLLRVLILACLWEVVTLLLFHQEALCFTLLCKIVTYAGAEQISDPRPLGKKARKDAEKNQAIVHRTVGA